MAGTAGLLTIGELAKRTGLRTSALRFYEQLGLLRPAGSAANAATTRAPRSGWPSWPCCRRPGFALAELVELDAQIRQATAAKQLLEDALACDCPHPAQCERVQAAGVRRAAHRPIRQPSRVAS